MGNRLNKLTLVAVSSLLYIQAALADEDAANRIISSSGFRGGLIVHLGSGDGRLAASLHDNGQFTVQGLDSSPESVHQSRVFLQDKGIYGKVSIRHWNQEYLPYVDNLVNIVVAEDSGSVPTDELMRVLVPGGALFVKNQGNWLKQVKPRPGNIDAWTHYLHDASGNAVAEDDQVGPPTHVQWVAAPSFSRSHEYTPSMPAMVSTENRLFYIHDDGLRGIFHGIPDKWFLYARDAFNGSFLWKKPLGEFGKEAWKGRGNWGVPVSIPRRLVAFRDRVWVTLAYRAPVSVLNAATGEILQVYEQTADTEEMIFQKNVLLVRKLTRVPDTVYWEGGGRRTISKTGELPEAEVGDETIIAVDTESGETLWKHEEARIVTLTLAASGDKVCYHNFEEIVCLDLKTGREVWRQPNTTWPDITGTAGTLVIHGDKVLYTSNTGTRAWALDSGRLLWTGLTPRPTSSGHPPPLLVAKGCVWSGMTAEMPTGAIKHLPNGYLEGTIWDGHDVKGLGLSDGKVAREIKIGNLISSGHHLRCYRSKATTNYLLWPKRGVEFVDITGEGNHVPCDWIRGECSYGIMPANGLLYVPPHPCTCYRGALLNGFRAMGSRLREPVKQDRLERGPAFGADTAGPDSASRQDDWPMYRHDSIRSGFARTKVSGNLAKSWQTNLGGKLTSPVIACGRVYVAGTDKHTVYALSCETGEVLWSYTADGRIDLAPTYYKGLLLFGCRDGWVYCLRASDGALVWRFLAASDNLGMMAHGQVESLYPVPGSILVEDDIAFFAAGRSSHLKGGIRMYGLDPITGAVKHEKAFEHKYDKSAPRAQDVVMKGATYDMFVSDGTFLHLGQNTFDKKFVEQKLERAGRWGAVLNTKPHLTATAGFTHSTWHERYYWSYSRWPASHSSQKGPRSGNILVFDETTTYGMRVFSDSGFMSAEFTPGGKGYQLFADLNDSPSKIVKSRISRVNKPLWTHMIGLGTLAMVLTDDTLFLAGHPDKVPPDDPYAGFEGRLGAQLWAISTREGQTISEHSLPSLPVFDGMVAANGRLYISLTDGALLCLR